MRRSILGDGLLERARATSMALLGFTAAVGLAIVALALNQGWPLIAGSSIPPLPPMHQDIGEATIAAGAARDAGGQGSSVDENRGSRESGGTRGSRGGAEPDGGSVPSASPDLVVSPSAPAKPQDVRDGDGDSGQPNPTPPTQPQQPPGSTPTAPSPATELVSAAPQPGDQAPTAAPPATASGTPDESSPPPRSNDRGHAYGRDDDWDDRDRDWDDDDDDWDDDHDWDDHDRGWEHHGRHDRD